MEYFYQESVTKKYWLLFIKRADGQLAWIATRPTLIELRQLVA